MANEYLGKDISLRDGQIQFSQAQDFLSVDYEDNLRQAIFSRLLTTIGEYFVTAYGSEMNNIVGNQRNELLRGEIIGYVSGALYQEPRINEIKEINVDYPIIDVNRVDIEIIIIPIESDTPLNLIFPLFLE